MPVVLRSITSKPAMSGPSVLLGDVEIADEEDRVEALAAVEIACESAVKVEDIVAVTRSMCHAPACRLKTSLPGLATIRSMLMNTSWPVDAL